MDISNGVVSKQFWSQNIFENETNTLEFLSKNVSWVPSILETDDEFFILRMTYCGISLQHRQVLPEDWREQLYAMKEELEQLEVFHNDLKASNVTLHEGRLYLIDFGHATFGKKKNKLNCLKPSYNDFGKLVKEVEKIGFAS
jgi:serine/threonine protein kinase